MEKNDLRIRLKSLRDEIHRCFTSSPKTQIRHAMLIVEGRRLSSHELTERWERFTKCKFLRPPLKRGTFRRDPRRNSVESCLLGEIDTVELERFVLQARAVRSFAVDYLMSQGIDYGPIPGDLQGLWYFLYCIAWDSPLRVIYKVENDNFLHTVVVAPGEALVLGESSPFESREAFEAWEAGKLDLRRGDYFATLSMDVRSCLTSAIDAITSLTTQETIESKRPAPLRDQSTEERDQWIYEKCCSGTPYKIILSELKNIKKWQPIGTVQGIRDRSKEHAKRHNLPAHPPRRS